jgi:fatty acid desaturase
MAIVSINWIIRLSFVLGMHECVHKTLFSSRPLNGRIGQILGAIIGVDFKAFATQHWLHHRSYGTEIDPQGFHYIGLNKKTSSGLVWHSLKGLFGLNLPHTFQESLIAPKNLVRLLKTGEILIVIAVQLLILMLVTGFGRHLILVLIPFISSATFGLFFSQLRGMAEHGAFGEIVEAGNVRSHNSYWLDQILLHDVNFNFHREHHLYPQCPSIHLPDVHKTIAYNPESSSEKSVSMFATLKTIFTSSRSKHG